MGPNRPRESTPAITFSPRVLLIENNPADVRLVRDYLRAAAPGATLRHVRRLSDVPARLAKGGVDAVLLDLDGLDGEGPAMVARLQSAAPDVALVVLSSTDNEGVAVACQELGAQDFLLKTQLGPNDLVRALRNALVRTRQVSALRVSEAHLRAVVRNAPILLFALDGAGRYTLREGRALAILGSAPNRSIGQSIFDAYPDLVEVHAAVRRALAGEESTARTLLNGHTFETRYVPERNEAGAVTGVIGVAADITGQLITEDALRASEAHLRVMVQASPIGVCVMNEQGVFTQVNAAFAHMLGYLPEELLHQPFGIIITEEQRAATRADFREMLESGAQRVSERVLRRKDGGLHRVLGTSIHLPGPDGRPGRAYFAMDIEERRQVEEMRGHLAAIVAGSSDAIIGMALDRTITSWNASAERLYGYAPTEAIGRSIAMLAVPDGPDEAPAMRSALLRGEPVVNLNTIRRHRDGRSLPVSLSVSPVRDESGAIIGAAGIHRDISAVQAAERRTRELADLLDQAHDAVLLRDPTTSAITYWNRGAERLYGWSAAEAVGHSTHALLATVFPDSMAAVEAALQQEGEWSGELLHTVRDGQVVVVESRHVLRRGAEGSPEAILEINRDITVRKQAEARMEHLNQELHAQARHDALTGLPNRVLFQDRLEQALRTAERTSEPVSLLLVDLNGFKAINDTLGHEAGDHLLQAVARRLQRVIRISDTAARLGGDEFAVLLPQTGEDGALQMAAKIRAALVEPVALGSRTGHVGSSIGIALCPEHTTNAEALKRCADQAMYRAKREGGGYALYTPEAAAGGASPPGLGADLRRAIVAGEIHLVYQPVLTCQTGRIERVEVLARWQHPQHGPLPPSRFIHLAEQSGQITPLTVHVLEDALRQCRAWRRHGMPVGVSVNVAALILEEPQFPDLVAALLRQYDMAAADLTLEVTERVLTAQPERALTTVSALAALGVRLSIDAFGTGHTSILQLRQLPIQEIKLDRDFATDLADAKSADLLTFLIRLGVALGVTVVVKGVETQKTWDWLQEVRCEAVQGFFVSPPLPADELLDWLHARP